MPGGLGRVPRRTGRTAAPWSPVETDISRTVQADRAFRIDGPSPEIVHLEMQSSSRLGIPRDLLRYNSILHHDTELPVHSTLMLLRRSARASDQAGVYEVRSKKGRRIHTFEYDVVSVWQESVESFLAVPGLSPLALLTDEAADDLPAAFDRFRQRLREPAIPDTVIPTLLTTSFSLCGLRHDERTIRELYMSLSNILEDSTTYQWIISQGFARGEVKGKADATRSLLLRQGRRRFGEPAESQRAALAGIADLDHLERLADRVIDATSWDDLLSTP